MRVKCATSMFLLCFFVSNIGYTEEKMNTVEYSCKDHFIKEIEKMLDVTERLWQEKGLKFTLKCRHTQNNDDEYIHSYQDELEFSVETPYQ